MKYINLLQNHPIIVFVFLFLIIILLCNTHLIFTINISNTKVKVFLKVKIIFNLIRFNLKIYPPKKKKKKKKKKNLYMIKFIKDELKSIFAIIKKLKIMELYSNMEFGNTNVYITAYIDAFINAIYANIANIINCKKLYLNIIPNFMENKFEGVIKIHIRFRLIIMFKTIPILFRILKNKRHLKEGDMNDSYKFHTKHYGNNAGND